MINISAEGELNVPRAFDKYAIIQNEDKSEFILSTPTAFKCYSVESLDVNGTYKKEEALEFSSAMYDSDAKKLMVEWVTDGTEVQYPQNGRRADKNKK